MSMDMLPRCSPQPPLDTNRASDICAHVQLNFLTQNSIIYEQCQILTLTVYTYITCMYIPSECRDLTKVSCDEGKIRETSCKAISCEVQLSILQQIEVVHG